MDPDGWLFPQWMRLPLEIRLMIWRATIEPRIVPMEAIELKATALELCLRRLGWDQGFPAQELEESIATAKKGLAQLKNCPPMTWTPGSGKSYNEATLARQVKQAIKFLRAGVDATGTPVKHIDLQKLAFAFLDNGVSLEYLRPLLGFPERTCNPDIEILEILVNYVPDGIHKRFQFGSTLYPFNPKQGALNEHHSRDVAFLQAPFRVLGSPLDPPSILAACRESRSVALKNYQLAFTSDVLFGTYFNFENDTLYFGHEQRRNFKPVPVPISSRVANWLRRPNRSLMAALASTADTEKVKSVAMQVNPSYLAPNFGPKFLTYPASLNSEVIVLFGVFPSTERVTVVVQQTGTTSEPLLFVEPMDFEKALSHYKTSLSTLDGFRENVETFYVKEEVYKGHLDEKYLEQRFDGELPKFEYKFAVSIDLQKKLEKLIMAWSTRTSNFKWTLKRNVAKQT